MKNEKIVIKGAKVHNLKNIDVEIPRDKMVVITGISGSGKSSLAFDTIYAEGQRRYVESLSAYARQFLGMMDKPDVERIDGMSPAISIDQKTVSKNPRSTVGTITEIYDYLRLLYARIGKPHCPKCGRLVTKQTINQILDQIIKLKKGTKINLLAPIISDKKGEHQHVLQEILRAGYVRVRFDGQIYSMEEALDMDVDKNKRHNVEVVVDRIEITGNSGDKIRVADSLETALDLGNGIVIANLADEKKDILFSQLFACPKCGINLRDLEPRNFSFNSPHGACKECTGLGTKLEVYENLVIPNKKLTLAQGAIRPWSSSVSMRQTWFSRILEALADSYDFSLDTPVKDLSEKDLEKVLYGTGSKLIEVSDGMKSIKTTFEGVVPNLERRYKETNSDYIRSEIERYMRIQVCPRCHGKRLRPEVLAVKVNEKSISDVTEMTVDKLVPWFEELANDKNILSTKDLKIAEQIIKEIGDRLKFLQNVGLEYITLDRAAHTLSGGEAQRIRLATQIGSGLVGVVYILDEPSIGLHARDNDRLIQTLKSLRDMGNTVIVVEHDEQTILESDYVIDIGPGAGKHGGELIFSGSPLKIKQDKKSLTGLYLSGKRKIEAPKKYRKGNGKELKIIGASEFNLKNINVSIPLGKFVCITGVSGSGKSTLMDEILGKALANKFYGAKDLPGDYKKIEGIENIDKVIRIDQSPIGRTPRSNPATYTGVFTYIRDLFAETPEARMRGYKAGRFSFNVKGGRCEACQGDGLVKIEMHFLPDVYVECEECKGQRYNKQALEIHYKGKNISEVLSLTIDEAMMFFRHVPALKQKLEILQDVGLGYLQLGQSATTLSGGEAQRIKLATELSRRATGKTLYILDEPTTGLHFEDVNRLLKVLNRLVDKKNTVLVIEHNLDVIKCADWIVDLGPEGGDKGGEVVVAGTPRDVVKIKRSYTGQYLKKILY
ncbi:MAG: excinuclease ABC subunit UvrA [Patescibacteria group bacterium]|nr:excinuclease ABC subunit UvrA [Patescibacteria group bacterium]